MMHTFGLCFLLFSMNIGKIYPLIEYFENQMNFSRDISMKDTHSEPEVMVEAMETLEDLGRREREGNFPGWKVRGFRLKFISGLSLPLLFLRFSLLLRCYIYMAIEIDDIRWNCPISRNSLIRKDIAEGFRHWEVNYDQKTFRGKFWRSPIYECCRSLAIVFAFPITESTLFWVGAER